MSVRSTSSSSRVDEESGFAQIMADPKPAPKGINESVSRILLGPACTKFFFITVLSIQIWTLKTSLICPTIQTSTVPVRFSWFYIEQLHLITVLCSVVNRHHFVADYRSDLPFWCCCRYRSGPYPKLTHVHPVFRVKESKRRLNWPTRAAKTHW